MPGVADQALYVGGVLAEALGERDEIAPSSATGNDSKRVPLSISSACFCAALRSSMTRRAAGAAAELEASGVRVPALCDLLDLPAVVVVVGTLGVLDAGAARA